MRNPSYFQIPPPCFHYVPFLFTLPYRKSPLHSVIIHHSSSGWELFTFLIDSLIEVKLRHISCRIIQICEGRNESKRHHEPDSRKWQHFPLQHHRHINLAKDKVTEEVVTAPSWILSPRRQVTEYILCYIVMRSVAQAVSLSPSVKCHISGDGSGDTVYTISLLVLYSQIPQLAQI